MMSPCAFILPQRLLRFPEGGAADECHDGNAEKKRTHRASIKFGHPHCFGCFPLSALLFFVTIMFPRAIRDFRGTQKTEMASLHGTHKPAGGEELQRSALPWVSIIAPDSGTDTLPLPLPYFEPMVL